MRETSSLRDGIKRAAQNVAAAAKEASQGDDAASSHNIAVSTNVGGQGETHHADSHQVVEVTQDGETRRYQRTSTDQSSGGTHDGP